MTRADAHQGAMGPQGANQGANTIGNQGAMGPPPLGVALWPLPWPLTMNRRPAEIGKGWSR